jgi:hypothetical protein
MGAGMGRMVRALNESLLCAETAPGTALEKLAAFLVAALDARRESGDSLSLTADADLALAERKRLREDGLMVRARLERLLIKGQRDGSIARRQVDSACAMILACLGAPSVSKSRLEQQTWDAELVELLLAAVAEPHPRNAQEPHSGDARAQRPVPPPMLGPAPGPGGALGGGLTLSSSTSNLSSEFGGIGGREFFP